MYYNCELFGEKVRKIRKNYNYTQNYIFEQTYIHPDTLRRIENGKVTPSQDVLERLSNPLKIDLNKLLLYYRIDNYSAFDNLKKCIEKKLQEGNYVNIEENLNTLYNLINKTDTEMYIIKLAKQFYLLVESVTLKVNKNDHRKSLIKLKEAIQITTPHFNLNNYKKYVYSKIELRILMNMALLIRKFECEEKCLEILKFCLESIEDYEVDYKLKILYNLSYSYHRLDLHQKSLNYAVKGIEICTENNTLHLLALLHTRKGIAKYLLEIKDFKDDLILAKNLHAMCSEDKLLNVLVKFCKELYGIYI